MKDNINARLLKEMLLSGASNLENNKNIVDKLNVFPVPDGDTGTNMSLTVASAVKEIIKVESDSIREIAKAASKGSLMGARGNSGVILSQLLRGFGRSIENKESITINDLAQALKEGSDTAYKAVIKPIEGTILTVARETAEFAVKISKKEKDFDSFFKKVVEEANRSLEKTPELLKNLKDAGVVDSGGKGLVYMLEGAYSAFLGKPIVKKESNEEENFEDFTHGIQINKEDIKFIYCTEFILESTSVTHFELKNSIEKYGDSLVVVGDGDIIKIHIHTNNPGKVMEEAIKHGQLCKIKIENMAIQHAEITNNSVEIEKYGFVTVAMGEGLASIFEDFGVNHVIEGGQTMNPSTEDFIKEIEKVNAENIIILPNNSNIVMAANQAKDLSDKNIIVIPSKTIPQGFAALLAFNSEAEPVDNEKAMKYALANVKSAQVTYAVRDSNMNGIEIKEGNFIGIGEGEIKEACQDKVEAVLNLIDSLMTEDNEIITLFYGDEVTKEEAENLKGLVEAKYEDAEVELYYGGQPLYYYIISIE